MDVTTKRGITWGQRTVELEGRRIKYRVPIAAKPKKAKAPKKAKPAQKPKPASKRSSKTKARRGSASQGQQLGLL